MMASGEGGWERTILLVIYAALYGGDAFLPSTGAASHDLGGTATKIVTARRFVRQVSRSTVSWLFAK